MGKQDLAIRVELRSACDVQHNPPGCMPLTHRAHQTHRGGKWLENPFCWETTRAREVMQHDVVDAARTEDSSGKSKQTLSECSGQPAGVERVSRVLQFALYLFCNWVRVTKHAPRGPFRVLERRHGLAEIVERGGGIEVERLRVNFPHLERESMPFSENASRYGHRSEQ